MTPDLRHLGRFDKSFFVRMVASFLLFTLAVAVVELGFRLGVLWYDFHRTDRDQAQLTAERVANDVRSIMLNRGGPVASRTVYPILARTFEQAGLRVAIEPSPVTTASIRKLFGFEPRGPSRGVARRGCRGEEGGGGARALAAQLPRLVHETHALQHLLEEIGFLESRLDEVADGARALLDRLLGTESQLVAVEQAVAPSSGVAP